MTTLPTLVLELMPLYKSLTQSTLVLMLMYKPPTQSTLVLMLILMYKSPT